MLKLRKDIALRICAGFIIFVIILMLIKYRGIVLEIVYPLITSLFIAYLLNPLVCRMELKGIKRSWGIAIIYTIFIFFLFLLCFWIIPVMVKDLGRLIDELPEYNTKFKNAVAFVQSKYSEIGLPTGMKNVIDSNINSIQNFITVYLESAAKNIIAFVSKAFDIILVPILVYYFLKDFKSIIEKLKIIIPRKYRSHTIRISGNIDEIFGNYIRSQIILSLVVAVLTSLMMFLLKVNFALVIGILNGVTNIIPYFGPLFGAIPAIIVALLQSPTKALYTAAALIAIQQLESNIICPKITADSVGLHPVTVILALIIGGKLFGTTGLILGVPAAAAIKVIYRDITKNIF
jgi:predicted PurR-regulated permease PerM